MLRRRRSEPVYSCNVLTLNTANPNPVLRIVAKERSHRRSLPKSVTQLSSNQWKVCVDVFGTFSLHVREEYTSLKDALLDKGALGPSFVGNDLAEVTFEMSSSTRAMKRARSRSNKPMDSLGTLASPTCEWSTNTAIYLYGDSTMEHISSTNINGIEVSSKPNVHYTNGKG